MLTRVSVRPVLGRSAFRGLLAGLILTLAAGCIQGPDVDFTVPANGASGVEPATEILIAFTSELDPETATDVANFVIFGSTSGTTGTTATLDETGRQLTIIPAGPFDSGEKVTISLTNRMTTLISIPLESYQFSFRIRGTAAAAEDFDPQEGQFLLTDLDPQNGSIGLPQRPLVRADFEANVSVSSIQGSVAMRGAHSGTKAVIASGSQLVGQGAQQTAGQILVQLAPEESPFEPGERVTIAYSSDVTAPAGGQTSHLRPFVASFEARGGFVAGGFSAAAPLPLGAGTHLLPAVDAIFGDFLQFDGPELVILDQAGIIHALRSVAGGPYSLLSSFPTALPVAVRAADIDDDGILEVLVVTRSGQLEVLQLFGTVLGRAQDPVQIPGGEPSDFEVADFDGDGFLDVVVAVAEGLQFIRQVPPLAPGLPGLPGLGAFEGLTAIEGDPLVDPVSEVEVGDLDGDGRIDIVARTSAGTTVLRNAGGFLFAEVSVLTVEPIPGTIRIADFDGDGRQDVITGGIGGVFVHFTPEEGIPVATWGATTIPLGVTPRDLLIGNIDGDSNHLADLLVYAPNAPEPLTLRLRQSRALVDFVTVTIPVSGVAPGSGVALADVDRDGARDILLFGAGAGGSSGLLISTSTGVVDAGDPSFAFSLAGVSPVDLGNTVNLSLSADLGEDISRLTAALSWHPSFRLDAVVLDPNTFPGTSIEPVVVEDSNEAHITIDLGSSVLSAGDTIHILELHFRQPQPQANTFTFSIESDVTLSGEAATASQVVLASDGIAFPDLSDGSVDVTMQSSVISVGPVTCTADVAGILLSWSIPAGASYDQIRIRRNGSFLSALGGGETSFTDESPLASGNVLYAVVGVEGAIESPPSSCDISLFGQLTCERVVVAPMDIHLQWITSAIYDSITIQRDGSVIGIISGFQSGFTDHTGDQNGHTYEVFGTDDGVDSSPAGCPQGEVPDTTSGALVVDLVSNVFLMIDEGRASVSWVNGENYDSVTIRRVPLSILGDITLPGSPTTYEDSEILIPGDYEYHVRGNAAGSGAAFVFSNVATALLPAPIDLTCTLAGGNQVLLGWTNVPVAYSYQSLNIWRTDDLDQSTIVVATLGGTETSFLDTNVPDGNYTYRVEATFGVESVLSSGCSSSLQNLIRVNDVVTTPGMSTFITIDGQLLEDVVGYTFDLRFDASKITITGVTVPGIPSAIIEPLDPVDSGGLTTVTITVSGVSIPSGFGIPFAQIAVSTTSDLSSVGESLLDLIDEMAGGTPSLDLAGGGTLVPTLVDGALRVDPYGLFFEPATVTQGGLYEGWIFGTFATPIGSYSISLVFDPDVLSIVEITSQGTVGELLPGFFVATINNQTGVAALAGISIFDTLVPQAAAPLAFVRFEANPSAAEGVTTIFFEDWTTSTDISFTNEFFLEDGSTLEPTLFAGTVEILGQTLPPEIDAIDPAIGPDAGGASVLVTGANFTPGLEVSFAGAVAAYALVNSTTLLAVTPAMAPGPVDVTITSSLGSDVLPGAYTYQALTLASVSPGAVNPCVETPLVLTGTGFPPNLQVRIGDALATILGAVDPDGTIVNVLPPPFSLASPGGASDLDVSVENPVTGAAEVLPGSLSYVVEFIRGDVDGSGVVDITDLSFLGSALAGSGPLPSSFDAADVDDDGTIHIGDLVYLGDFLSGNGSPPPPAPYPLAGPDPTPDGICP